MWMTLQQIMRVLVNCEVSNIKLIFFYNLPVRHVASWCAQV